MMFGPTLPLLLVLIPLTVAVVTVLVGVASLFSGAPAQPRRRTFEAAHAPVASTPRPVTPAPRIAQVMPAAPQPRDENSVDVLIASLRQPPPVPTHAARRASTEFPVERTAIAGRPIGLPSLRPQLPAMRPVIATAPARNRFPKGSERFPVRADRDFSDNAPTTLYGQPGERTTDVDLTPTPI